MSYQADDYSKKQAIKDADYARDYKAWFATRPAGEQKRLMELGLDQPLRETDGYGWGDTDPAEFPEASVMPKLPIEDGEVPVRIAAIENEEVLDILRRLIGELIAERNARLSLECLALATGFSYLGGTMTAIAQRHGVTRAAVSKRCVELIERLNLQPSRAMRSLTARRAYQAAQNQAYKHHELFGNHHP
jgi:hypothetical protein